MLCDNGLSRMEVLHLHCSQHHSSREGSSTPFPSSLSACSAKYVFHRLLSLPFPVHFFNIKHPPRVQQNLHITNTFGAAVLHILLVYSHPSPKTTAAFCCCEHRRYCCRQLKDISEKNVMWYGYNYSSTTLCQILPFSFFWKQPVR